MDNPFDEIIQRLDRLENLLTVTKGGEAVNGTTDRPLTTKELCEHLRITEPTVIRYRKKGLIPYISVGSAIRYNLNEVLKALEK